MPEIKSSSTAYCFWLFSLVGVCGIHRFYAGKWITGIIWLLTGGLFFIGQIIDLFLIPRMVEKSNQDVTDFVRAIRAV
jgi:TM2 domain-containing membrane protein YozV